MTHILVSGAASLVESVSQALHAQGADVTGISDLADIPAACADAGKSAFDAYVQLPATFQVEGKTAIARVHHFYAAGVLARFTALDAAMPSLMPGARLTFVLGVLPREAATEDDRDARRALTRVLSHAARADLAGGQLTVRMLDSGTPPDEIAQVALGRRPGPESFTARADLSYDDWRVEVMGLFAMET